MKRLNATGNYLNKKQAQPITQEQENRLWELGLLGDHNAQVLLNTTVYQVGYFFALRSGNEHRRLQHYPSQIQLHQPPGDCTYLVYREDISKTNQGGLTSKKKNQRKYINMLMSKTQGGVLYGFLYNSKCAEDCPPNALAKPKAKVWYSKGAMGHNTRGKSVK